MTWQDIMGFMRDDCVGDAKTTSSRRGKVKYIEFSLENWLGTTPKLHVTTEGRAKLIDTTRIAEKLELWEQRGNSKKVEEWKRKLDIANAENIVRKGQEFIDLEFYVPSSEKYQVYFNGVKIDQKHTEIIGLITDKDEDKYKLYCALRKKGFDFESYEKRFVSEKI